MPPDLVDVRGMEPAGAAPAAGSIDGLVRRIRALPGPSPLSGRRPKVTARPALIVDTDDPTPPYEQLRRQLAGLIESAVLQPGDRLPPCAS